MSFNRRGEWGRWLLLSLLAPSAFAAQEPDPADPSPYSDAWLVAEVVSIRPGEPFTVGLRLVMDEGWHSYWRNAGDSGTPTTLEWDLPDGFEAREIQWPYPFRIERPPLASYGYEDEVLLLVEIRPPPDLAVGRTVTLAARADWLICEEPCYPATADVAIRLPVRDAVPEPDRRWSDAFAAARARLPVSTEAWRVSASTISSGYVLEVSPPSGLEVSFPENPFFAGAPAVIDHAAPQPVARSGDGFRIRLSGSAFAVGRAGRLEGVLLVQGPDNEAPYTALAIATEVIPGEAALEGTPRPTTAGSQEPLTLLLALGFAFLGGLLLNLMPCVLPVLSIKVLGFVEQGGTDPAGARLHGAAYGLGVLICFWILAGALLVLRAAGQELGWGFQLQSPLFVAFMALLFFFLGLMFLGVVEVGVSLTRLGAVGRGAGYRDSLLTGVLAVVVATPCTAPFMGAALGFALARPAVHGFAVFTALGIGMALPYVFLSASPALLRRLPRPGRWMESLKQFLAFPLFATVVWLLWVFGRQTGVDGVSWLLLALTFLGLAAWILGRWGGPSREGFRRVGARTVTALILLLAAAAAWAGSRQVSDEPVRLGSGWQPFSAARVAELRSEGRPVFVDFTAAWCLTCQVNERVVLADATVQDAFGARDVALLKADWTKRDPAITEALRSFGRSGVPLYVLYSPDPAVPPRILPEILSVGIVLDALSGI